MENQNEILNLAKNIARVLDNKKAHNVQILKVTDKTIIADYFVIANGTSSTQVKSLADEVEYQIGEKQGIKPANINRLVGSPEICSAEITADGPGTTCSGNPCSRKQRTSLYPGSEIRGEPASLISATDFPCRTNSAISGAFCSSLWS